MYRINLPENYVRVHAGGMPEGEDQLAYKGVNGFLAIECLIGLFLLASSAAIIASLQWLYFQESYALERHQNALLIVSKTLEQCVGKQKIPKADHIKQGIYSVTILTEEISARSLPLDIAMEQRSRFFLITVTVSWPTVTGNISKIHATTGLEVA